MAWFAGALLERPPGPKYVGSLGFAEFCPPAPLPKPRSLSKWRGRLPPEFQCALRSPASLWGASQDPFPSEDELRKAVDWLVASADALGAPFVVLSLNARLTTGQRDRNRLKELVDTLQGRELPKLVWLADGLWEHAPAATFAAKLGVTLATVSTNTLAPSQPPVAEPNDGDDFRYSFLSATGAQRSLSASVLSDHAEQIASDAPEMAFTTITSTRSFDEALLLQQFLSATR